MGCVCNMNFLFDSGENVVGEEIDNLLSNWWECFLIFLVFVCLWYGMRKLKRDINIGVDILIN